MSLAFFIERGLTKTEAETAILFCEGLDIIDVCVKRQLGLSSVKDHWTQMKRKLKVSNRVQLKIFKDTHASSGVDDLYKKVEVLEGKLEKLLNSRSLPFGQNL